MTNRNAHRSFQKILMIVFAVAFGVVALAIGYQAMQQNTEGRSKAAEEQTIVKQWEFNGNTFEGWKVPVGTSVSGGYLQLPVVYQIGIMNGAPPTQPTKQSILSIENSQVGAVFTVGKKLIKLMVAVGPQPDTIPIGEGQGSGETVVESTKANRRNAGSGGGAPVQVYRDPNGVQISNTYVQPIPPPVSDRKYTTYTLKVSYAVAKNSSKYIPIPSVVGIADGQLHEMVFAIPSNINKLTVSGLRVEVMNVPTSSQVRIDWIRLAGSRGTILPTPTPTRCGPNGSSCSNTICPVCKPGQICPSMPCQITTGTCQNGQCIPQTCYPRPRCLRGDEFSDCQYAGAPEPLPPGAVYCSPTPTPTPSIGCKYVARPCAQPVGGVATDCGMELICPTTSITPIPPVGCRYQPVECVKAPCEQIMVCTTDAQGQQ